jgi:hypothetical protein
MPDQPQEIVVAIDLERSPDVVERLRDAGMDVTQALPATGVVTGSAPASRIADIQRLDGVTAVEASRSFNLPSPDSPVQ